MGWKAFAAVFTVITILGVFKSHLSAADIFDAMMEILAAIGLALFAFKVEFLSRRFWQVFALGYAAYSLVCVVILSHGLYKQYAVGQKSLLIILGAFLVVGGLQLAVSLGLWLYVTNFPPRRPIERPV
jgi:hypothetical protein